jgi:hypothetical protein
VHINAREGKITKIIAIENYSRHWGCRFLRRNPFVLSLTDSRKRSPALDCFRDGRLEFTGEVEYVDCFIALLVLLVVGSQAEIGV